MSIPLYQVDAFAEGPFSGNPAAVCLLEEPRDAAWMQQLAAEMNLSETAYVLPGPDGFQLRWFTPQIEVPLCGHATLAAAHVLWEQRRAPTEQPIRFHTQSGVLTASRGVERIELDFPLMPEHEVTPPPAGLLAALGLKSAYVGRNDLDYIVYVAEASSEAIVRGLRPDFAALATIEARGFIVTARAEGGPYDFLSRYFAPAAGIDEDPVTGSAHCCLAAFWQGRLGKDALVGYQASARGGVVHVRVEGDRAVLGGKAVTVLQGALTPAAGDRIR